MNTETDARQLRIALQRYFYAVGKIPCPGAFASIHVMFNELSDHNFHIRHKPWLNAYELAALTNDIAMFGTSKRNHKLLIAFDKPLNEFKKLWKLAEESNSYSDNPDHAATFVLRIVYQQLPYVIHHDRIVAMFRRMSWLLSTNAMGTYVTSKLGVSSDDLLKIAENLFERFTKASTWTERDCASGENENALRVALNLFLANSQERRAFHKDKLESGTPAEKPYEVNTLLRYPIIRHENYLYCPYPQLIGYAATRGLFFRFSEEDKTNFCKPFSQAIESYVKEVLCAALPNAEILTEADERNLGWTGKVNDVTAIMGDSALLVECKLSGLYVDAKRTASPENIIADVRKQIANAKDRSGLFQLYDKCQAIRSRLLPTRLMEKYKNVRRIYPVLLLYDEVQMANKAEVLGNIVRDELRANGVDGFEYQIWHLEELDWLAEFAQSSSLDWIAEKFVAENKEVDMSSFLADKAGKAFLKLVLYLPEGDTKAIRILKRLIAGENA
jgi:hypothetical protein